MKFTIVTPSLNQMGFLKRNVASVADQEGVEIEHIVQDAGSTDGTGEWLAEQGDAKGFVEKDEGMYDAINRGIRRGSGEICAWLNCDEQYLPGALRAVREYFEANPDIDIVFGHTVIVDAEGNYVCHRKAVFPETAILRLAVLPVHSSSMFFRRRLIDEGLVFDTAWKALGDWDWVLRARQRGFRMAVLARFLSSFADTGENLDLGPNSQRELARARAMTPRHLEVLRPIIRCSNWVRKFFHGHYRQAPFQYEIYTPGSSDVRVAFQVEKPTFYWKSRMFAS